MTTEQIKNIGIMENVENNKIIVDFMGLKPVEVFGSYSISKDHVSVNCKNSDDAMNSFCKSTKYHSDWNWLMEVVENIENLGNHGFTIYRKSTNIKGMPIELSDTRKETKIQAVYSACIDFINWHNEQNTKLA